MQLSSFVKLPRTTRGRVAAGVGVIALAALAVVSLGASQDPISQGPDATANKLVSYLKSGDAIGFCNLVNQMELGRCNSILDSVGLGDNVSVVTRTSPFSAQAVEYDISAVAGGFGLNTDSGSFHFVFAGYQMPAGSSKPWNYQISTFTMPTFSVSVPAQYEGKTLSASQSYSHMPGTPKSAITHQADLGGWVSVVGSGMHFEDFNYKLMPAIAEKLPAKALKTCQTEIATIKSQIRSSVRTTTYSMTDTSPRLSPVQVVDNCLVTRPEVSTDTIKLGYSYTLKVKAKQPGWMPGDYSYQPQATVTWQLVNGAWSETPQPAIDVSNISWLAL